MQHNLPPIIFVIDDDANVRNALQWLFESVRLAVETFESPLDFFNRYNSSEPGCLVVDVRMPEMSGLEFLEQVKIRKIRLPVIMISGHGDIPMAVRAMKAGAVDFIAKPLNDQNLLEQIQRILAECQDIQPIPNAEVYAECYATLTERERQVLDLIVQGRLNKQIAQELGIAMSTVELHRTHVMQKMRAKTLAELIRMYFVLNPHFIMA